MGVSGPGMMVCLPSKGKSNTWLGKPNTKHMGEYLLNKNKMRASLAQIFAIYSPLDYK